MRRAVLRLSLTALLLSLVTCASWAQGAAAPPRHDFPNVGPYLVLAGDFHMHTLNSDGRAFTTRARVEESYALGYDVIAITDHGTTRGYRIANYVGGGLGMVVIRGLETGIMANEHMNALGVSSDYRPVNPHKWAKKPGEATIYYLDAEREIARCGGIVIYNHPHCGYNYTTNVAIKEGLVQGIEVKNDVVSNPLKSSSWRTTDFHGNYCYPDAFEFALKNNLTIFADTDVHGIRNPDPARTLVFATARTPEAVMDAFRARRTAAWFGGMLWGREALLSDLLRASVKLSRGTGAVLIENLSPAAFKGTIEGTPERPFELPAYGKASVDWTGPDSFVIRWDSVWTSSTTNLKLKETLIAQ